MRKVSLSVLAIAAGLVLATSAGATISETVYTLEPADDPLAFTAGGTSGQIQAIAAARAATTLSEIDSVCMAGVCDIANQDWLIFEVAVTGGGSLDSVGLSVQDNPLPFALGMGYFLEGGPVQDGSGLTNTYSGSLGAPTAPLFSFLDNGGAAGLTGTSLVLFVAYADGYLPQMPAAPFNIFGEGAVSFMIAEWGTSSPAGPTIGNFTEPVPEPGTALLLGMGVLMLGARARNRRS
jgi:hypothetical protein